MKHFIIPIIVLLSVHKSQEEEAPPNLIFVLADDQGFNDIGYNNDRVLTPKMDELAAAGVTIKYNYMQQQCTPSRVALLTGMYPYHVGRQGSVIKATQPTGLTLDRKLLSDKLTGLGYDSHMVGKWHLGFCNEDYLPLSRGFASHYGYWEGEEEYYTKEHHGVIDFHEGNENLYKDDYPEVYETYSTYLYQDRVDSILEEYAEGKDAAPLFLYFPIQSPHDPLDAPQYYLDLNAGQYPYDPVEAGALKAIYSSYYKDAKDQTYKAMLTALDDVVGNLTAKLKEVGIYDNTVIVVSGDNGADPRYNILGSLPLKGFKGDLTEGGVRVPGFIHSPLLTNPETVSESIVHATDWYPTFLRLAGMSAEDVSALELDGVDQYDTFFGPDSTGDESPRTRMVHNIKVNAESEIFVGGIRDGPYKYIREPLDPVILGSFQEVLYNIDEDFMETTDLAEAEPEITAEMSDLFEELASSMSIEDDVAALGGSVHVDEDGYVQSGWCDV